MLLAIWDDGVWQDALRIAIIALVAYLLVMWVSALVWAYRDVASRTRDTFTQTVALILVLVFNLPGLLLYLILRPKDTLADQYDRQLEAEALLHEIQEQATCPSCRRKIEQDYIACPYCRTTLRVLCEKCSKPLTASWALCPYCGADRPLPAMRADQAPRPSDITVMPSSGDPAAATAGGVPAGAPVATRTRRPNTAAFTPPATPAAQSDPAVESGP